MQTRTVGLVEGFCQRLISLTGRMPIRYSLAERGNLAAARIRGQMSRLEGARIPLDCDYYEMFPHYNRLNIRDRAEFRDAIDSNPPGTDVNSTFVSLSKGIESAGVFCGGFKVKGNAPLITDSRVEPYFQGSGFVPNPVVVLNEEPELLIATTPKFPDDYKPSGSLSFRSLVNEIEFSIAAGTELTDPIVGFGIFPTLEFNGQPVGFVTRAVRQSQETRGWSHVLPHLLNQDEPLPASLSVFAFELGKVLRSFHEKGIIHQYPHLDNFTVYQQNQIRLLDLTTAFSLKGIPRACWPSWIYLDLSRILTDLIFGPQAEGQILPAPSLAAYFLSGYLGDEITPTFQHLISQTALNKQRVFDYPYTVNTPLSSLLMPYGMVKSGTVPTVNLTRFNDSIEFRHFMESIANVANRINLEGPLSIAEQIRLEELNQKRWP